MRALLAIGLLLYSGSAFAQPDGGVVDVPLAEPQVVKVDGGFFVTDAQMLKVGENLAKPCPAVVVQPAPATGAVEPFFYGVATGATLVALSVVAAFAYGYMKR